MHTQKIANLNRESSHLQSQISEIQKHVGELFSDQEKAMKKIYELEPKVSFNERLRSVANMTSFAIEKFEDRLEVVENSNTQTRRELENIKSDLTQNYGPDTKSTDQIRDLQNIFKNSKYVFFSFIRILTSSTFNHQVYLILVFNFSTLNKDLNLNFVDLR